jgi:hypothetical protein
VVGTIGRFSLLLLIQHLIFVERTVGWGRTRDFELLSDFQIRAMPSVQ